MIIHVHVYTQWHAVVSPGYPESHESQDLLEVAVVGVVLVLVLVGGQLHFYIKEEDNHKS